jgi:transglutaminase-like putative cysteine protease
VIYRVVHRTAYRYDTDVSSSYGEAHLHPRETTGQRVYSSGLTIEPYPEQVRERRDFFGNRTTYFTVREPHTELVVTSTSLVDVTDRQPQLVPAAEVAWDAVRDLMDTERSAEVFEARQFLLPSRSVPRIPRAVDYARSSFPPGRAVTDAVGDLATRVHADFEFSPGTTSVTTTIDEVLDRRAGVCQDFAHVTIAALRGLGLAARYVSGYLETIPPPGQRRLKGSDVSHAWVSTFVPQVGWIDIDPTNDLFVNDRYVTTAWGRDYDDVPPLKGVIFTQGEKNQLEVSVDVEPVPEDDPVLESLAG